MQQVVPPLSDAFALAKSGKVDEAIQIIQAHAERGNGEALFVLGDAYWRGSGFDQDLGRGRELFGEASAAGFPVAEKAYTNLLSSGIAGSRDWDEALRRLEHEAVNDGLRALMLQVLRAMNLDANGDPAALPQGERLSDRLEVTLFRGAFTRAECEFLRVLAEPTYERTGVVLSGSDSIRAFMRTADGSTIHWLIEDPATHAINRRLAALTGTDVSPSRAAADAPLSAGPGISSAPRLFGRAEPAGDDGSNLSQRGL